MTTHSTITRAAAAAILWSRGELSFLLHSAQLKIYELIRSLPKDQREACIFCARRFGKSYLGVICALEDAIRNPGKQIAIIGPTLKQTRAITTPIFREVSQGAPRGLVTHSKSESRWNLSNGSTVLIGGFDTILESIRGLDLAAIYLEESGLATADLEEYNYLLYSVLMPTLMHTRGRIYHLTTPSRIVDHPLHIETLPKTKLNSAFYCYTIDQNPLLSPSDIEKEIETLGGASSPTVLRELYCVVARDPSTTVVPQFDESRHVAPAPMPHLHYKYLVGGDLGYTNDLSVFHLMAYDHDLGKVLVFDEKVFQPETASSEMVESLKDWSAFKPTFVVDIQGNTRTDMSSLGMATATPVKDKFESTVTFIRNQFFQDLLLISPDCPLLIATCRSQMFNRAKTDFLRTTTLGHADSLMSCIYGLRSVDRTTDLRPRPDHEQIFTLPTTPSHISALRGLAYKRARS